MASNPRKPAWKFQNDAQRVLRIESILEGHGVIREWRKTCDALSLTTMDAVGRRKSSVFIALRRKLVALLSEHTSLSLVDIGELLGRDHTTILNLRRGPRNAA